MFLSKKKVLQVHIFVLTGIIINWYLFNGCVLTHLEYMLDDNPQEGSFFNRLLYPYQIEGHYITYAAYVLWIISALNLLAAHSMSKSQFLMKLKTKPQKISWVGFGTSELIDENTRESKHN